MTSRKERFKHDTAEHQIEVVTDLGSVRYIKCRRPKTSDYHFNITTWPGYLCISGDMGCFVFQRLEDMFNFFRTDGVKINIPYWGEKVQAGVFQEHCDEAAEARVAELVEDETIPTDHDEFGLLNYGNWDEIIRHLMEHGYEDAWEESFMEPTFHFEWCLRAIVWAIAKYDAEIEGGGQ